jgi:hypothetical protein
MCMLHESEFLYDLCSADFSFPVAILLGSFIQSVVSNCFYQIVCFYSPQLEKDLSLAVLVIGSLANISAE